LYSCDPNKPIALSVFADVEASKNRDKMMPKKRHFLIVVFIDILLLNLCFLQDCNIHLAKNNTAALVTEQLIKGLILKKRRLAN
jgi:hypothetical protein